MNCLVSQRRDQKDVESLLLKSFKEEPFHNLYLLYDKPPLADKYGGTCSDKTISFISSLKSFGYDAELHTGYINSKEIHRLARISIQERTYFADVGNGWPATKLYPADEEICFNSFGMKYRTVINNNRIFVYHTRNEKESLQLEIDKTPCDQEIVKESIARRFSEGIKYPFSNSLRFSLIVENRFLFLRGEHLEIYSDDSFNVVNGVTRENIPKILKQYFKYYPEKLFTHLLAGNGEVS